MRGSCRSTSAPTSRHDRFGQPLHGSAAVSRLPRARCVCVSPVARSPGRSARSWPRRARDGWCERTDTCSRRRRRGGLAGRPRRASAGVDGPAVHRPAQGSLPRVQGRGRWRRGDRSRHAAVDRSGDERSGSVPRPHGGERRTAHPRVSLRPSAERVLLARRPDDAGTPGARPRGCGRVPGPDRVPGRRRAFGRGRCSSGARHRRAGPRRERRHRGPARHRRRPVASVSALERPHRSRRDRPGERRHRAAEPVRARAARAPRDRAGRRDQRFGRAERAARRRAGASILPVRIAGWQPDAEGGYAVYREPTRSWPVSRARSTRTATGMPTTPPGSLSSASPSRTRPSPTGLSPGRSRERPRSTCS